LSRLDRLFGWSHPDHAILPLNPEVIDDLLSTVLPPDDSAVRFGRIQGGLSADLETVFSDLYLRFVEEYLP
jgi:hypothetical protein